MRARACLSCLALIGAFNSLQADWSDYKAVSLAQAWVEAATPPNNSVPSQALEGAPADHKFLIKAAYTGKHRKMGPVRLELIAKWGKFLHAEEFAKHFQDEIEVRAEGITVWLALQDVLVEPFLHEVKTGAPVQIWMMYIGAAQQDRVFLVNEFQAVK